MSQKLSRLDRALLRAGELHRHQRRKASDVPYIAHLWGVASLVLEMGGSEDEVIAALLHDAPEDQGGQATLDAIQEEFGPEVARIVLACSDTLEDPKPPWRARKEAYLDHLKQADASTLKVSLADKIYNGRSIVHELRAQGEVAFERFSGKREGTLWYYRTVSRLLAEKMPGVWAEELQEIAHRMHDLAGVPFMPE